MSAPEFAVAFPVEKHSIMPDPTSAPLFRLEIARLQRCFTVLSFSASEAISQPFTFELDILGDGLDLDLTGLMYKPASLSFGSRKNFHGQIQGATRKHYQPGPACYTLIIGPRLACLGLRHQSRIFQHMTATRIITQVLEEHGLKNCFRFDLPTECRERDCCVQYQESDLQLVQRLCAEEGIHYHFVHSRHRHELVFGANLHGFARSPVARWRQFAQQSGVTRFAVTEHATDLPG
ncbi:Rhs element Vgr protein, partial [Pseudomonas savastanoi pv. glycinea]